jgi:uncharacterized repeat protein (TIGR01451 family)
MKKVLLVALIGLGLMGMVMVAGASTNISNWCTGTYTLAGANTQTSGSDSAVVARQTAPNININKFATNLRTGQTSGYSVNAVQNDTVEYYIYWNNVGEADADTVVLNDYVPTGMNFSSIVAGDTIVNGTKISYAQAAGTLIQYIARSVGGTDAGAASGGFKFRAIVQ